MNTVIQNASPALAAGAYSRKNPFLAELTRHDRLTGRGSLKDTRHFVLNLDGSRLSYTPGDSLGVFGHNPPELVEEIIELLGFDPETAVDSPRGQPTTLRETLLRDYTLNRANRKILTGLAERIPQGEKRNGLMEIVDNNEVLCSYIESRDYIDILKDFPEARFDSPEGFISQLSPVTPRLYSIASSPLMHPREVHLCIEIVRYETHGRAKKGLVSGYFADHTNVFVKNIPVYIQESRTFRLPADPGRDIIMCGPGTGIAPFRAFIEHRIATNASGRSWLFFGEQHRATEFLYEHELTTYQEQGKLQRLDLAFSRDQEHKIYVQHRMREQADELWAWLQEGAYFYVCGDARHMAKDVHQALIEIAQSQGGMSPEAAAEYVNTTLMKTEKRYLRDVY